MTHLGVLELRHIDVFGPDARSTGRRRGFLSSTMRALAKPLEEGALESPSAVSEGRWSVMEDQAPPPLILLGCRTLMDF